MEAKDNISLKSTRGWIGSFTISNLALSAERDPSKIDSGREHLTGLKVFHRIHLKKLRTWLRFGLWDKIRAVQEAVRFSQYQQSLFSLDKNQDGTAPKQGGPADSLLGNFFMRAVAGSAENSSAERTAFRGT